MKGKSLKIALLVAGLLALMIVLPALAARGGSNGTTLAGYKTLDICSVNDTTWRYSGEIAVWNEGAIDTTGFAIQDFIEFKFGNKWLVLIPNVPVTYSGEIPAGTTQLTALTFPYSYEYNLPPVLPTTIRNTANLTILNHSAHLGTPFGPSPKASFLSTDVKPCPVDMGCTYTQGYWGTYGSVENPHNWPAPYSRDAYFFLSGLTWQQVMDTPVNVSQGYYQLAHQYIAAVLNQANGAYVPEGVQDTLDLAYSWLGANGPAACTAGGSCGLQKDWAKVLDDFNNGVYPGGPGHCSE